LSGSEPKEGCVVKKGSIPSCWLNIDPTDPNKKIIDISVKFPAETMPYPAIVGVFGRSSLSLGDANGYLSVRTKEFFGGKIPREGLTASIPILIRTKYEYEGTVRTDRSVYFLFYHLMPSQIGDDVAIPRHIQYCGRLQKADPEVDFIVDPWRTTSVGFLNKRSHTIDFGCNDRVSWIRTERGSYKVQTDLVWEAEKRPASRQAESIPLSGSKMRFQSNTRDPVTLTYWLSEVR